MDHIRDLQSRDPVILMNELRVLLDSVYSAIIAVDINGRVTFINEAAKKFIVTDQDVIDRDIREVIPESSLKDVLKSAQPQYGIRLRIGDRTALANRTPILENGMLTGAVSAFLDITDLESVSHQLRTVQELNNELNVLIDSSADGMLITDCKGHIIRLNKAYRITMGIPLEEELTGLHISELIDKGYLLEPVASKVLETGNTLTLLQEIHGREILLTETPVLNKDGRVVRVIVNIRDLTEFNTLRRNLQKYSEEVELYRSELSRLKLQAIDEGYIFNSPEMQKVLDLSLRVAQVDTIALITGESGVGKEIIARVIREASKRSSGPFVKINCGALTPSLVESELFGYEEGAFTGANKKGKPGIFEMASGGTLFLDEVGELSLDLQVKLLRVIQEREVTRLGGTKSIPVDVRIIAATNRDLRQMVEEGTFRRDLFYRLNVVNIHIPPLRDHVTDIPLLVDHFVRRFSKKYNLMREVSPELLQAFSHYEWPGNIRELENTIERMVILSPDQWLDCSLFTVSSQETNEIENQISPLKEALAQTEKKMILKAYELTGSTRKAAALLGINQSTVVRKLQSYAQEIQ